MNDILESPYVAQPQQVNYPLKKHVYPWYIKIAGLMVFALITFSLYRFSYDLPRLAEISQRVRTADFLFRRGRYKEAIGLYYTLLKDHPGFSHGKCRIAKACFALSEYEKDFYYEGLTYLEEKYNEKEFNDIKAFVPYVYKSHFESCFKRKVV